MIKADRIALVLAAHPQPGPDAVEPVLRVLLHDLNGALSAVTMEAFVIERLASGLVDADAPRAQGARPSPAEALVDSAQNLRQAADGIAAYLGHVDELLARSRTPRDGA